MRLGYKPFVMIEVRNLVKRFAEVTALNNVSLQVDDGELFGLIGPDGAGKTTLFRVISSLLLFDEGHVKVAGKNPVSDYAAIRQMIGYMPGKFSLYQDLSILENLRFFAAIFKTTLEENYDLIKDIYVQIEPFKHRPAGKLSGGMKQKLALCCALVHKPRLLLLDEPTTGVDAVSRIEFWEILKRLKQQGITIMVSTPYMDEASLCERIALIQQGQIMGVDSPDGIIKTFSKPLFAVKAADFYSLITDLRDWNEALSAFSFGEYVHLTMRSESSTAMQVESYLYSRNHSSVSVKAISANVEDSFMYLMLKKEESQ